MKYTHIHTRALTQICTIKPNQIKNTSSEGLNYSLKEIEEILAFSNILH